MTNLLKLLSLLLCLICVQALQAQTKLVADGVDGGGDKGHGGDEDVVEFIAIAKNICRWASQDGIYEDKMSYKICTDLIDSQVKNLNNGNPQISFEIDQNRVTEAGVPKEAVFFKDGSVRVMRPFWKLMNDTEKYTLVAIELAGLLGVVERYDFGKLVSQNINEIKGLSHSDLSPKEKNILTAIGNTHLYTDSEATNLLERIVFGNESVLV